MIAVPLHTRHERKFEQNRFVYPVLSRRSEGISIGVNLNPDKVCNFDCIYCQVDRTSQSETQFVETAALLEELGSVVELCASGAIFVRGTTMTVVASTLSGNTGTGGAGGPGNGGPPGLPGRGSGGLTTGAGTSVVGDTISAGNTANNGGGRDVDGAFTSNGYNLIGSGDHSTGFTNGTNHDQVGTDTALISPQLGPLQNNDGPTDTMALLSNSPALDKGDDSVVGVPFNLTTDQRGYPRKIGSHVDVGAFEYDFGERLRIISIVRSGNDIVVTFQTIQGVKYRLERKLAITDSTWNSISGVNDLVAPSNGSAPITDPGAANLGKAFYRVRILP